MRRLILVAAMAALVLAKPKPETYKETEDFQYSRSSSDDGTKSGFYGAQRGNVGGNYERAHNMDTLAQHQMSGLVRQVDGELGDGAKTRTGSVYTAANSRGIYGSGNYDLSNLKGRNFAEGESHLSQSSQHSSYGSQSYAGMERGTGFSSSHAQNSKYSGFQTAGHTDQRRIDNVQAVDTSQGLGRYESGNQAGYNTQYQTQYGSRGRSDFDHQSSANLHSSSGYNANDQAQYITTPVRVVVRPGGRVAIPISAPTYSVSQNRLSENKNAVNSDAEILNQHVGFTPTSNVKHYEASYNYRKQWEKHHELPGDVSIAVPTENPFPKNSELYEDAQLLQSSKNQFQDANSLLTHSSNVNSDHRAYTKSAAARQSRFQSGINTQQSLSGFDARESQAGFDTHQSHSGLSLQQHQAGLSSEQRQSGLNTHHSQLNFNAQQKSAAAGSLANAYGNSAQTSGIATEFANNAGDVNLKPKSYQSSYSYHKSWERQGDPYIIKPAGSVYSQAPEKLTAASSQSAAYSQYGSRSRQAHQRYPADCDEEGHVRVARSNTDQQLEQDQSQWEDLGQQSQSTFQNLEDLGQQQQNKWDNLQDLGQQTQNKWDNLEQLGQETQNQWDNLQKLGQQTQDSWDHLEELGQQTQSDLEQHQNENLEDFGQHAQEGESLKFFAPSLGNENAHVIHQVAQKEEPLINFEQRNQNEDLELFSQQSQNPDLFTNFEQQANTPKDKIFNQYNNNKHSIENFEQKMNIHNETIYEQHGVREELLTNFEQQANGEDIKFEGNNNQQENLGYPSHSLDTIHTINQQAQQASKPNNIWSALGQQEQSHDFDSDKNLNSYDFMKPTPQHNSELSSHHKIDKTAAINDKPNLFTLPINNIHHDRFWSQTNRQDSLWNTDHNQNINGNNWHSFLDSNDFSNHHSQFESSFPQSTHSTSVSGNPLQSLWDKIDNIAGEITVTESKADDKNIFSNGYSNIYSQSNVGSTEDLHWSFFPVNTNKEIPNSNGPIASEAQNLGHNKLFDDEIYSTTTVIPNHSKAVDNTGTFINTLEQDTLNGNKNINSQDEGRGDIGPEDTPFEITTDDKSDRPYKTQQEIEALSLTNGAKTPIIEQSIMINKHEVTTQKLSTSVSREQENGNNNKQFNILSNTQPQFTTTMPTVKVSTTVKTNTNIQSTEITNHPIVHVVNINSNPLHDSHSTTKQNTGENTTIPNDLQQENLEQQYEDFGQLQSSWFPANNQQYGHDQQNLEQQFEVIEPFENMQDQSSIHDFGQQIQSSLPTIRNVQPEIPTKIQDLDQSLTVDTKDMIEKEQKIVQPLHVVYNEGKTDDKILQNVQEVKELNSESVPLPEEIPSENDGFWQSIGTKFSSAKNKVFSWFKNR